MESFESFDSDDFKRTGITLDPDHFKGTGQSNCLTPKHSTSISPYRSVLWSESVCAFSLCACPAPLLFSSSYSSYWWCWWWWWYRCCYWFCCGRCWCSSRCFAIVVGIIRLFMIFLVLLMFVLLLCNYRGVLQLFGKKKYKYVWSTGSTVNCLPRTVFVTRLLHHFTEQHYF